MRLIYHTIILAALSISLQAQTTWSAPQLICDSIADNLNPSFIKAVGGIVSYNKLLWERDFGDHSIILFKDFSQPDSERAVTAVLPQVHFGNPRGYSFEFDDVHRDTSLIVYQSDQNGNEDLYSIIYDNETFHTLQQITQHSGNDIHPDICLNFVVWERDSSIYFSECSFQDSTWGTPVVLDSGGCSRPRLSGYKTSYTSHQIVYYMKTDSSGSQIYLRERDNSPVWQPPRLISSGGDNRNPDYFRGEPFSVIWQYKAQNNWDIKILSPLDTTQVNFSSADDINPAGFRPGIAILPLNTTVPVLSNIAFESNLTGDWEIYASVDEDFQMIDNISNYAGSDRRPSFSDLGMDEGSAPEFPRYWLVWERFNNGKWQTWGSFAELDLTGIDDTNKQMPESFHLYQNYPNPFNPSTTIRFEIPLPGGDRGGLVTLTIYDLLGKEVKTLLNEPKAPGTYTMQWDGTNKAGNPVGSGVYVYQLKTGRFTDRRKMVLIR